MSVYLMIPRERFEELFPEQDAAWEAYCRLGAKMEHIYGEREINELVFEVFTILMGAGMVKGAFQREHVLNAINAAKPIVEERFKALAAVGLAGDRTASYGVPVQGKKRKKKR